MPTRRFPTSPYGAYAYCRNNYFLRRLLGGLWIADLQYIFDVKDLASLQRVLDGVRIRLTDYGYEVIRPSGLYAKYNEGKAVPGDDVINWLCLNRCSESDRVLTLHLWRIIHRDRFTDHTRYDKFIESLSDEVCDIVFRPIKWSKQAVERRLVEVDDLARQLEDLGSVDALAALIALLKERRDMLPAGEKWIASSIECHVRDLFRRLSVFPPFYDLRTELCDYIECYVIDIGADDCERDPWEEDALERVPEYIERVRVLLVQMIALGLAGPTFKEQMQSVKWLYEGGLIYANAIETAFAASEPYVVRPDTKMWTMLQEISDTRVQLRRPITLDKQSGAQRRVANVLGETPVISRGPETPFNARPSVVRKSGRWWCSELVDYRLAKSNLPQRPIRRSAGRRNAPSQSYL